jgi:hypothetical protein
MKEKKEDMGSKEGNATNVSAGASLFAFEITLVVDHEGCC